MLTATAYDIHVEQLFNRIQQLHSLFTEAGIPYRLVGGMAVYIHVFERDPIRARLTSDVDAAIERSYLPIVRKVAEKAGWVYRHSAGIDMLIDAQKPRARSAVHLYTDGMPDSLPDKTSEGILIAPVVDLVRMKLTGYRLKDRVHIQDLDGVGLITPEIEAQLSASLLQRLAEVRASE